MAILTSIRSKEMDECAAAGEADLILLHNLHRRGDPRGPFLMDIYEPLPFATRASFLDFISENARAYVIKKGSSVKTFLIFHDFQEENRLANLDVTCLDGAPVRGSCEIERLGAVVRKYLLRHRLTRLQSFILSKDEKRANLLKALGFREEGVLREHFFHEGSLRDIKVLAWNDGSRHVS